MHSGLIIGGDAVAFYGVDRVSLDYDIWIKNDIETYKSLTIALCELGYLIISELNHKVSAGNKFYEHWEIFDKFNKTKFYFVERFKKIKKTDK